MTILMGGYFGPAKPKFNEIANCVNYFPGEFTLSKTSRLHVWQCITRFDPYKSGSSSAHEPI